MILGIQDIFKKQFKGHNRIWGIEFMVLDHETAIERKLINRMEDIL